jgi:hypothetical protein
MLKIVMFHSKEKTMKKLVAVALLAMLSFSVSAQVKCESDGRGGMCCWDTRTQGPFKPFGC